MPISIFATEKADVTKLACRTCGEKIRGVGLLPNSNISGLSFKCRRCGALWEVKASPDKVNNIQERHIAKS